MVFILVCNFNLCFCQNLDSAAIKMNDILRTNLFNTRAINGCRANFTSIDTNLISAKAIFSNCEKCIEDYLYYMHIAKFKIAKGICFLYKNTENVYFVNKLYPDFNKDSIYYFPINNCNIIGLKANASYAYGYEPSLIKPAVYEYLFKQYKIKRSRLGSFVRYKIIDHDVYADVTIYYWKFIFKRMDLSTTRFKLQNNQYISSN
jgi:hypothetical protein